MKYLILFFLLSGCATGYVPAEKSSDGYGYSIKKVPESANITFYTHTASFIGNPKTRKSDAKIYTEFAALEYCLEQNKKLILITGSMDLSRTYRTSELGLTSNGGLYSYDSHETLPAFLIAFRCDNQFKDFPQVATNYRSIKAELIKDFINDFKGGVQLEGIKSKGVFKSDDVLLRVNGQRVLNLMQIYDALVRTEGISAKVEYIRDKKVFKEDVLLKDKIAAFVDSNDNIVLNYCKAQSRDTWEFESCDKEISVR